MLLVELVLVVAKIVVFVLEVLIFFLEFKKLIVDLMQLLILQTILTLKLFHLITNGILNIVPLVFFHSVLFFVSQNNLLIFICLILILFDLLAELVVF